MITFRTYRTDDCAEMIRLFYDTVHTVNRRDYTEEQVNAWASPECLFLPGKQGWDSGTGQGQAAAGKMYETWNRSFLEHYTVVAEENDRIAGFGDIDDTGFLDRLYIHREEQGRGIASSICSLLEERCAGLVITTHASITARPFFERRGYTVVLEQQVERRGVLLVNFVMIFQNPGPPSSL